MIKRYLQAVGIWCLIIPLAVINGGLRETVLIKLGSMALPLSGVILSACIFAVTYFLIPKIKRCQSLDYILFGLMWFILTNLFDLGMLLTSSKDVTELFRAYDFTTGNLWILVVLTAAVSPWAVSKIRKI